MALRLTVYDRAWRRVGAVEAVRELSAVSVCNGVSALSFAIDNDVAYVDTLLAAGSKVVVRDELGVIEGFRVTETTSTIPSYLGTVAVKCAGFNDLLARLVGHPVATQTIPSGSSGTFPADYDHRTGPFETVAKALISAAATRIGEPVTVSASQGRGPTVTVDVRNESLADVLYPLADQCGMNITVTLRADETGYLVDVTPRRVLPFALSEESNLVVGGKVTLREPKGTRALVGGQGEKAARVFYALTAADGREATWGARWEVFRDARDASDAAALAVRAQEALAEAAAAYEIELELAEAEGFQWRHWPGGYDVGDSVIVATRGVTIPDWIRSVEWTWKTGAAVQVSPLVGDHKGNATEKTMAALSLMQRRARREKAGT